MQGEIESILTKAVLIEDDQNGVVRFSHADKSIAIVFDWGVIAHMQATYGKPQYMITVAHAIRDRDVLVMADLVSRASGQAQGRPGAMTPIEVMQWSPPLVTIVEAIETAWLLALFGPTMKPEGDGKAKSGKPLRKARMHWASQLGQLFALVTRGESSGGSPHTQQAASQKDTTKG